MDRMNKHFMAIDKDYLNIPESIHEDQIIQTNQDVTKDPNSMLAKDKKTLSYEIHVCVLCSRLFRSLDTLLKHR